MRGKEVVPTRAQIWEKHPKVLFMDLGLDAKIFNFSDEANIRSRKLFRLFKN